MIKQHTAYSPTRIINQTQPAYQKIVSQPQQHIKHYLQPDITIPNQNIVIQTLKKSQNITD